jgi:hypothetical protein
VSVANRGATRAGFYATVALAGALLVGAALGFAAGRWEATRARGTPAVTMLGVSRAVLLDSLGLTPDQRVQVEQRLDDALRRSNTLVDGMLAEVRTVTEETRREVRALLDDGQRARFDSILATARPLRPRTPVPPRREGP